MRFTARDIRRGVDVFTSDGVLLGTVVHISGQHRSAEHPPTVPATTETALDTPFSGETLGPMPTTTLGNRGPAHQQAAAHYATAVRDRDLAESAEILVFRTLVALNWRTLWPRLRRYPISLVLNVSHERIVLAATALELDTA